MDCSVIIINYNTKKITADCIKSVMQNTKEISYEIILVDNNSTDGSREYFRNFNGITFLESPENLGFGRANNLAVKNAVGDFLFFLNSDTLLFENSIQKMISFFRQHEQELRIGSLGCILVDAEKKINGAGNSFPTCEEEIENIKSSLPIIGRFFGKKKNFSFPLDKLFFEIDYVIGADLLMKRVTFEKLKGFDPDFFMYYEESDLQKRMCKLGLRGFVFTGTKIIHLEDATGKSIAKYSNKKRTIVHKSKNIYLKKNDPKNFNKFVLFDRFYLWLNKFNGKYTKSENDDYINEIKKTYL